MDTKGAARSAAGMRPPPGPAVEAAPGSEQEHRHFPRAGLAVRFALQVGSEDARRFSASLTSINVSVSGAFLASTFFLPLGTELNLSFALAPGAEPVLARGEIVREEREDEGPSGFGVRFVEFYGQTEVELARLFLEARLHAFAAEYLASARARSLPTELDRVVDTLAAWELLKAMTPGDPWRGA